VRARVTQAVDVHNLVTLPGNVHPWARPENDQGVAPDDLPMERMLLVLQRSQDQEASLRQLLDQQQVKSSPMFHQWLAPVEFGQQFGPADADIQAVTDWLASQGFTVKKVAAGRTVIEFSGSAGLVRQALGTEVHKFRVKGGDYWANTSDPQIPAALAPVVAGFASLNNFPRKPLHESLGTFRRSKATGKVQPLFTYPAGCRDGGSGPCYVFAVGPADFATIYNVAPLWSAGTDGTGQTIAVVGETNINPQDVADFRSMFGLPANPPNIILNGPDPGINGDEREADLDVEWSGGVAKGATIDFVVSETTEATPGIDLSALYIIDNNLAPIMSESYGVCEAELGTGGNVFHSTLWEQAAAQGITVLMAAGDSGSAGCDRADPSVGDLAAQYGLAVSGFASTPFNVAVGGTDFNDPNDLFTYWNTSNISPSQSSAKSYIPESTWNNSCADIGAVNACTPPPYTPYLDDGIYLQAGGGGPSSCTTPSGTFPKVTCSGNYPKPSWQSGEGVPNDNARDIPDLSLFAGNGLNFSFYIVCQMDANADDGGNTSSCDLNAPYTDFQAGAGTSASAQVFAGIMALVNQSHGRQGNANYVLYPMAAAPGASCNSSTTPVTNSICVFYDVTAGNNSVICQGGSPNCSVTTPGQYGIMVTGNPADPNSLLVAAYPTTTGYDLATGLGSVNVANLVNNWKSNFTPSGITLALATNPVTKPITLTHGQPIDFTIDVTSGSGTPTGDVSLIAQAGSSSSNMTGIGPFTLSGGSATGSTVMLPGGSYQVTAHYPGNGTYGASDSTPGIPVTVAKESSKSQVQLIFCNTSTESCTDDVTSLVYGASPGFLILRADVTSAGGQPCASPTTELIVYPCPTGTVNVTLNGQPPTDAGNPSDNTPGTYLLNSQGYAEDQFLQFTVGTFNVVASYKGDTSYTASTSPTVPITMSKAPTTTALTGIPASFPTGTPINFNVSVTTQSYGVNPSGEIQILDGSTSISYGGDYGTVGGATYASLGAALVANFPPGPGVIKAIYPGDGNYATSSSAPLSVNVTDFSVSSDPTTINISAPGQSGSATITLTPLYGFTGTVSVGCNIPGAAPGISCSLTPVNITGSSPVKTTLTFTTTPLASSAMPPQSAPKAPPSLRPSAGWLQFLAALLALALLLYLAITRRRPAVWLFSAALLLVGIWVACGGGSSGPTPTPTPTPEPGVTLSSTNLTFPSQNTGTTSAAQSVTLTNPGNATLVETISLTGTNSADFSESDNCNGSVAAGGNCSISVKFAPTAMGTMSASVSIADNASGSPQTISLSGTGTQPPTTLTLSPATLAFGQENLNAMTAPKTATLTNTGQGTLNISNITIIPGTGTGPDDFLQTNTCGSSVLAGAKCTISVTFQPIDLGALSAALTFTDNAGGSPQSVNLTGTGLPVATPPGSYPALVLVQMGALNHSVPITVVVK
jgi:hypothetical protein